MSHAKIIFCFILVLCSFSLSYAQKAWTLQECIDYALEHNLNIKQQQLNAKVADVNLREARMASLPNLNASVTNGYNFGRSIDPYTNSFVTTNISNTRFSLSTGLTLFNGFQIYNNVQQQKQLVQASKFDLEVSKNDIGLQIANAYLQVLFAKELVKTRDEQLVVSETQLQRQEKFFRAGTVAESAVLDLEAQLANDELNLVNAENQLKMAKVTLFQLLYLNPDSNEVAKPTIDSIPDAGVSSVDQLYLTYLTKAPEVQAADHRMKANYYAFKQARGAYMPRISLGADINTVFSENYRQVVNSQVIGYEQIYDQNGNAIASIPITVPTEMQVTPFNNQLSNNLGQSLGISMSIPIFNNYRTKAGVRRAEISYESARINMLLTNTTIRQQVTQAYTEYLAAKARYKATEKAFQAQQKSFEFAKKRHEANLMSTPDYRIQQGNFQMAETNFLQAKYELMFRYKIIDFYKSGTVKVQ